LKSANLLLERSNTKSILNLFAIEIGRRKKTVIFGKIPK
jgi:hypothetical protein